jgi:hypothetical protein
MASTKSPILAILILRHEVEVVPRRAVRFLQLPEKFGGGDRIGEVDAEDVDIESSEAGGAGNADRPPMSTARPMSSAVRSARSITSASTGAVGSRDREPAAQGIAASPRRLSSPA